MMDDLSTRVLGWRGLLINGDPCVLDRWMWVRRHLRGGDWRTFDAGCGNGAFSIYAATLGNHVLGASFSDDELRQARRRTGIVGVDAEFEVIDLRQLSSNTNRLGQFDQILCLETIEHIRDDQALVSNLASMLKPGGQLLVTTPYLEHRPLLGEDLTPAPNEDGGHVTYGYTHATVGTMLERAGLMVTQADYVSGIVSQRLTDAMRLAARFLPQPLAWLLMLPLRPLTVFDRPLTSALSYPYLSVALQAIRASGG